MFRRGWENLVKGRCMQLCWPWPDWSGLIWLRMSPLFSLLRKCSQRLRKVQLGLLAEAMMIAWYDNIMPCLNNFSFVYDGGLFNNCHFLAIICHVDDLISRSLLYFRIQRSNSGETIGLPMTNLVSSMEKNIRKITWIRTPVRLQDQMVLGLVISTPKNLRSVLSSSYQKNLNIHFYPEDALVFLKRLGWGWPFLVQCTESFVLENDVGHPFMGWFTMNHMTSM